ncbi:MAG: hypothetical protein V7L04_14065 [Nostoc sp.]|uniref:hypothetical protein n=1 Tax=Nostoc sp. TaxID=1180 RepID=UPI002FF901FF
MTLPKLELSVNDYIKIIAGKPVKVPANNLVVGSYYKLIDKTTKTYMEYRLHSVVGDWSYWK